MSGGDAAARSRGLPPFRAVFAVDTMSFGRNTDPVQRELADQLPSVVARAFDQAGAEDAWRDRHFVRNPGDGYWFCCSASHLPVLLGVFGALQDLLLGMALEDRGGPRMRLRASLHVGPIADPGRSGEIVGNTVITAHRLLDAQPARDALERSDPDQTLLVAMISAPVYDSVVATGLGAVPAARFAACTVQVKELSAQAYLYVPCPSGDLLRDGVAGKPLARTDSTAGGLVVTGSGQGIYQPLVFGDIVNGPGTAR
ncbi:hypothetical protein [Kutzneria sp. 744]|uniref:hypothetical protein n=1 Tax=Kutzneria sp. (strain 744) TaxID=345341 RepID=UPI0003EEA8E4|nr:hypothetical protein [Kutzneria sp. 744]EWM19158.1 hypothetical protein KUTG_09462 [Kutzneria sp. 744]